MTDTQPSGAESALDLPIFCYTKEVHPGWREYNLIDEFSSGHTGGEPLVKLSDARAALARRATAPHTGPAPADATQQAIFILRAAIEAQLRTGDGGAALQGALDATKRFAGPDLAAQPVEPVGDALVAKAESIEDFLSEYDEIRGDEGVYTLTAHDKWVLNSFIADLPEANMPESAAAPADTNPIADYIADNWPMKKYTLEEIDTRLRALATQQPTTQAEGKCE